MAGGYAHITVALRLTETDTLLELFPKEVAGSLLTYYKFTELGSVSPDLPYLAFAASLTALLQSGNTEWADRMHHTRGGDKLRVGIKLLRDMKGEARMKALAWLLGYAAHVGTDLTIHPMVNAKVGPYEQNKTNHRICEMHQDVHTYGKLGLGNLISTTHLQANIGKCGDGKGGLDADIRTLWAAILRMSHPEVPGADLEARIDSWYAGFRRALGASAETGLFPFARHLLADQFGAVYPNPADDKWLKALPTPKGEMHYDAIFEMALANVKKIWGLVGKAVLERDDKALQAIHPDWNLDNGEYAPGKLVFWS